MTTVKRLTHYSEILELQFEWNDLLERSSNKSIFMTWEWFVTWWEVFGEGNELWWLVVRDQDSKLIGGVPLYLKKQRNGLFLPHRELRFVGSGAPVAPEHLDLVAKLEHSDQAIQVIGQYLSGHFSEFDILYLTDVSDPKARTYQLGDQLSKQDATCLIEEQLPKAPYIPLPKTWEEYFKSLSPKMRAHISRHRRKVEREFGAVFSVWSPKDGALEQAFNEFEALFAIRKESVGIGNKFEKVEGYRAFHHRLASRFAERGWLYLAFLKSKEKALAAEYLFRYQNILYSYQFGFEQTFAKNNVFKVLRSYVAENAIQQGVKEFDLLRGEESYKYDWGAVTREKKMLRCFSPTFYGRTLRSILELRKSGKRLLRMARNSEHGKREDDKVNAEIGGMRK